MCMCNNHFATNSLTSLSLELYYVIGICIIVCNKVSPGIGGDSSIIIVIAEVVVRLALLVTTTLRMNVSRCGNSVILKIDGLGTMS